MKIDCGFNFCTLLQGICGFVRVKCWSSSCKAAMGCLPKMVVKNEGKWYMESPDLEDNQDCQVLGLQERATFKPHKKIPPVCLTKGYFVERGVCGEGLKPEKIRLYKQVTLGQYKALFGKAIGERKKFDYRAYKSGKLRAKIEKLWPLLHSSKEMPTNGQ